MNPVLTHLVGPDSDISEFSPPPGCAIVGDGKKAIYIDEITPGSPAIILDGHGALYTEKIGKWKERSHYIDLFHGIPSTYEVIQHLMDSSRHFYIPSCFSRNLLPILKENKNEIPPHTTFTIYGSKKFPLSGPLSIESIQNIYSLYGKCKSRSPKKINKVDRKIFERELYSPWDVTRCEITSSPEGNKITAVKTGSPKTRAGILRRAKKMNWKPSLKVIYAEDEKVVKEWKKRARKARPAISIQKYRHIGSIEAICHRNIPRIRTWLEAGAEINPKNDIPPLVQACLDDALDVAKELITHKADVNARYCGYSLARCAQLLEYEKITDLLLSNGASLS